MKNKVYFTAKEVFQRNRLSFRFYLAYIFLIPRSYWLFIPAFVLILFSNSMNFIFQVCVSLWQGQSSDFFNFSFLEGVSAWLRYGSSLSVVLFFFSIFLLSFCIQIMDVMYTSYLLVRVSRTLHDRMVDVLGRVRVTFFDENPTGRVLRRFSVDYDQLISDVVHSFIEFFWSCAEIFWIFVAIVTQTFTGSLICFVLVFVYYRVQRVYRFFYVQIRRMIRLHEGPIWSLFSEIILGYQTIRVYGRNRHFLNRLRRLHMVYTQSFFLQLRSKTWLELFLKMLSNVFVFCVGFVFLFLVNQNLVKPFGMAVVVSLILSLDFLMQCLTRSLFVLDSNMVSAERMMEYTKLPHEGETLRYVLPLPSFHVLQDGRLEFRDYSASYRPGLALVLERFNLTIDAKKRVGIVGRTGAGKSSLFQALFRMLYVQSGQILFWGLDIHRLKIEDARSLFTLIPQDPFLFSGTVRDNLDRLGQWADRDLFWALEIVKLDRFVKGFPKQLDQELIERGAGLSLGQRQLLCIARAVLSHAPVVLMDEATASVDLETDDLIHAALHEACGDKTILIIAHRLSTLRDCDEVITLSNGQFLERGRVQDVSQEHLV